MHGELPNASCQPAPRTLGCRSAWGRGACLAAAGLSFLLGLIGIVVPGLPTTPFLLLTAALLSRSSPRLHRALLDSRVFGGVLRDWQRDRSVSLRVKVHALAMIFVAVVGMAVWSPLPLAAKVGAGLMASIGALVVASLSTTQRGRVTGAGFTPLHRPRIARARSLPFT